MTIVVRLVAFTVVLAVVFAASFTVGRAAGPFEDEPPAPTPADPSAPSSTIAPHEGFGH